MQEIWVRSWVRKIPWRRKWQPTSVSLLGKCHGQKSLAGYSQLGHKKLDNLVTKHQTVTQYCHWKSFSLSATWLNQNSYFISLIYSYHHSHFSKWHHPSLLQLHEIKTCMSSLKTASLAPPVQFFLQSITWT